MFINIKSLGMICYIHLDDVMRNKDKSNYRFKIVMAVKKRKRMTVPELIKYLGEQAKRKSHGTVITVFDPEEFQKDADKLVRATFLHAENGKLFLGENSKILLKYGKGGFCSDTCSGESALWVFLGDLNKARRYMKKVKELSSK